MPYHPCLIHALCYSIHAFISIQIVADALLSALIAGLCRHSVLASLNLQTLHSNVPLRDSLTSDSLA